MQKSILGGFCVLIGLLASPGSAGAQAGNPAGTGPLGPPAGSLLWGSPCREALPVLAGTTPGPGSFAAPSPASSVSCASIAGDPRSSSPQRQLQPSGLDRLCEEHRWVAIVGGGVIAGGLTYLVLDGVASAFNDDPESPGWGVFAVGAVGGAAVTALVCAAVS